MRQVNLKKYVLPNLPYLFVGLYAIWTCMGYTVLLCFTLFKTGSMARSVFNAH